MTTTQVLGPYECRSPYRDLGPVGIERAAFRELVRLAQHPQTGDGAARSALPPAVAAPPSQPVPSPSTGGAR